jgi:hypothetical protein
VISAMVAQCILANLQSVILRFQLKEQVSHSVSPEVDPSKVMRYSCDIITNIFEWKASLGDYICQL